MSKTIRVDPLNLEGFMEDLHYEGNARRAKRAMAAHRRGRHVRESVITEGREESKLVFGTNQTQMDIRS
jgi:hypothetical protein